MKRQGLLLSQRTARLIHEATRPVVNPGQWYCWLLCCTQRSEVCSLLHTAVQTVESVPAHTLSVLPLQHSLPSGQQLQGHDPLSSTAAARHQHSHTATAWCCTLPTLVSHQPTTVWCCRSPTAALWCCRSPTLPQCGVVGHQHCHTVV